MFWRNRNILKWNSKVLSSQNSCQFEFKLRSWKNVGWSSKLGINSLLVFEILGQNDKRLDNCELDERRCNVVISLLQNFDLDGRKASLDCLQKEIVIIRWPVSILVRVLLLYAGVLRSYAHDVFMAVQNWPVKFEPFKRVESIPFVVISSHFQMVVVSLVYLSEPREHFDSFNFSNLNFGSQRLVCPYLKYEKSGYLLRSFAVSQTTFVNSFGWMFETSTMFEHSGCVVLLIWSTWISYGCEVFH